MNESGGAPQAVPTLARRVGPVVAAVGLLGAAATLVWIAVAPDNVVGSVAAAGLDVPAVAVTDGDDDGCVTVVDGDGSRRGVCAEVRLDAGSTSWTEDGRLAAPTRGGEVVVDPATGAVVSGPGAGDDQSASWREFDEAHVDGTVVREGSYGGDGRVVLDLGAPVGRLRGATVSPDGDWAVAVHDDGRVLVARTAAPSEVHVWFETDPDVWFDPWTGVRWLG